MADASVPFITKSEPNARPWRPWALSKAGLLSYFVLCSGLFITNEVIISLCRSDGCHVFGHSSDGSMPDLSRLFYISVPIILSIFLSLRWVWSHHDILRLEPYFQMGTEGGAKDSSPLFLRYPHVFCLLLPWEALKNKHYIVVLSWSILQLMNCVVVLAVPVLFDSSPISNSIRGEAMLVEFNSTAQPVSPDSTFFAYDYAWRNGKPSPFMTAEYALLPIRPLDNYVFVTNETWKVQTTLLEAELRCNDAQRVSLDHWGSSNSMPFLEIFQNQNTSVRLCDALALKNNADSNAGVNNTMCDSYMAFTTPWSSFYWQMEESTKYPAMSYMFGWASGPSSPLNLTGYSTSPPPVGDITAIFCTPEYYTQPVNAIVFMPDGAVHNIERHGKRRRIDPPQGFDRILDGSAQNLTGVRTFVKNPHELSKNGLFPLRFGYPQNTIAKIEDDLLERFGVTADPVKPPMYARTSTSNVFMTRTESLAAFALYNENNSTLETLRDTNELKGRMEKGLKTLFAFAIATASADINGTRTISLEVNVPDVLITVNKIASNAIRVGLLLSLLLFAFLGCLVLKRSYPLNGEPDTMAAALKLLSVSPAFCAVIDHAEFNTQKELMSKLEGFNFRISKHKDGGSMIRVFFSGGEIVQVLGDPPKYRLVFKERRGSGVTTPAEEVRDPEWEGEFEITDQDLKVLVRGTEITHPGLKALEEGRDVMGAALRVLEDHGSEHRVVSEVTGWLSPAAIWGLNLAFFPILFVVLVATFAASTREDGIYGLPMPSNPNSLWSKVLFKNFPVVVASIGEALLISLGAVHSVHSPYQRLISKGFQVEGSETLDIDYNLIPVQFQFLRPVYNGLQPQNPLRLISVSILLSNLLAVFMGGLFFHSFSVPTVPKSHDIRANLSLLRQEIYFQLDRNITSHYSPSWTTGEYYIDPPFTVAPSGEATYNTRGFGVDISCTVVPDERVEFPCSNSTRYRNHESECPPHKPDLDNVMAIINPCGYVPTRPAYWGWPGSCYEWAVGNKTCPNRIYPVWAENRRYFSTPPGADDQYHFVVLNCSLTDRIVDLRATVRDGQVLSLGNVVPVSSQNNTYSLARSFATLLIQDVQKSTYIVGPHPMGRINQLMVQMNPAIVQGDNTHIPSVLLAQEAFAEVLKRLFPLLVRLHAVEIFEVQWLGSGEYRAYIDKVNFGMTLGLLVLLFCVVAWLLTKKTEEVKGHVPENLAAVYSHLYACNTATPDLPVDMTQKKPANIKVPQVYKYGTYPDKLGKHHGVYKEVALDLSLEVADQ